MFFSVIVEGLNIMLKTKQSKASVKINFPNVDDGILKSEKDVLN